MNKRIITIIAFLLLLIGTVIVLRIITKSNEKIEIAVVTYVTHPILNTIQNSFKKELERLTHNKIEYRVVSYNAQGKNDNLPSIARQVLTSKPEIVVTISTPVSQHLMREANEIQKIVYTFVTNPDDLGDDLVRTNSTGLSDAVNYTDNIELIKEIFGEEVSIGMLYNPNEANSIYGIKRVEAILRNTPSKLIKASVAQDSEIPTATNQLLGSVDVIYVGGDNTVVGNIITVISRAHEKGIPVFASDEGSIKNGAIAGFSVDYTALGIKTAEVVKMVLDGKEPRNIKRIKLEGTKLLINKSSLNNLQIKIPERIINQANLIE